ncbi:UDP-N-acetylglucosamine transporter TMEM241 homolog [Diadema setosum]|uniref:UDP-N-acetylglucosamine transporter TMEM241 homolog n=1 Tax=Diadema setosum TaxID=31175 RepID=UPI003B3B83CE
MAAVWLPIAYCILYICTVLTNKYVLWVLGFTFPTLFQGWQTLVGFLVLRFIASLGHIDLSSNINRSGLLQWMPFMLLYVLGVYSGSRALARLPVPVFVCLQGAVEVISALSMAVLHRRTPKMQLACSWVIISVSCITIWLTDPQYDQSGYNWMLYHVVVGSQSAIYVRMQKTILLSDIDRLHYVYAFSVFLFAPGSFFLGDLTSSAAFPHWYLHHFYVGCIMSGILGVSLSLCHLYMEYTHPEYAVSLTVTAAKILCVGASNLLYLTVYNTNFFLSLFFSLAGQLINAIARHDVGGEGTDEDVGVSKVDKEQA